MLFEIFLSHWHLKWIGRVRWRMWFKMIKPNVSPHKQLIILEKVLMWAILMKFMTVKWKPYWKCFTTTSPERDIVMTWHLHLLWYLLVPLLKWTSLIYQYGCQSTILRMCTQFCAATPHKSWMLGVPTASKISREDPDHVCLWMETDEISILINFCWNLLFRGVVDNIRGAKE